MDAYKKPRRRTCTSYTRLYNLSSLDLQHNLFAGKCDKESIEVLVMIRFVGKKEGKFKLDTLARLET